MNEKKLVLRDARPEELDGVAALIRDANLQYKRFFPGEAWANYERDMMDVRSRLEDSQLIVAELDGKLSGAVTMYLEGRCSSLEGWPEGWAGVRLLAVPPAYRGQGIGRALMEECIRRCRQHGVRIIGLHTSEMMGVAKRMYEKMGFVRAQEFDVRPRPDVVVLAYKLDLNQAA